MNAWTLEGSYALQPQLLVYAKTGRSYRIPNVDDNFFLAKPLVPQTSNDAELGASIGSANRQLLTVKVFQHNLKNEIMFDANTFSNANLDPTKRRGIEIEASTYLTTAFKLSAMLQHVSAKFTSGPNKGNDVVLVPKNIATLRLNWLSLIHI